MTSFYSIAQRALDEGGHTFHYHLVVQKAAQNLAKEVFVYAPLASSLASLPDQWVRWFHPYSNQYKKLFQSDCKRLFLDKKGGKRIFFFESFGRREFRAFALAALLHGKKEDYLWIVYRDDPSLRNKKDAGVFRFFTRLLRWKFGAHLVPLTDSEKLLPYYEGLLKRRPHLLPIPHTFFYPIQDLRMKKELICIWPGSPREEKGMREISQLLQIQDDRSEHITLNLSEETPLFPIRNGIKLSFRQSVLSKEFYFELLKKSDIVLLPYDPHQYKWRTSGIFVETIMAGKIPLVKGGWLADELEKFHLQELIVDWEDPQFFSHLFALIQLPIVYEKLRKMQSAYAAFHSEENFTRLFTQLS